MSLDSSGQARFPLIDTAASGGNDARVDAAAGEKLFRLSSSERIKDNITSLNGVLASTGKRSRLYHDLMDPVLFQPKNALEGRDQWVAGLITERVAQVFPEAVSLDGDGEVGIYSSLELSAHMLAEIRNLRAELDELWRALVPGWEAPELSEPSEIEADKLRLHSELVKAAPKLGQDGRYKYLSEEVPTLIREQFPRG